MNRFDTLPQSIVRRTETPTARSSASADEGKGPLDDVFSSLLNDLSEGKGPDASNNAPGSPPDPITTASRRMSADLISYDSLNGLGLGDAPGRDEQSDVPSDIIDSSQLPSTQSQAQTGSLLASLLGGIPPQVLPQALASLNQGFASNRSNPANLDLGLPTDLIDATGMLETTPGPSLKLTVQQQEAHFKPIVEGFSTKVVTGDEAALAELGIPADDQPDSAPSSEKVGSGTDRRQSPGLSLTHPDLSTLKAPAEPETQTPLRQQITNRSEETRASAAGSETGAKPSDATSLPPAMLQRIASAVLAQAEPMTDGFDDQFRLPRGATLVNTARASEGVMRVLNIQLHPAELGLVTVKMKLSGEHLEMQIEVSNEETARLLRSDSEKLSGLLRGSGYRPDLVSIQVGDSNAPDRNSFQPQRDPSMQQSQPDSFRQGTPQEDRSRHRSSDHARTQEGDRDHAAGESASSNRIIGGLYL